ncbi:ESX-2 secretion system protein eccD2 [Mycobacterium sp. MFM001]|uniref:type VII secretion integral membrane protein EccD n=1 Tax=Mycobacterium sp. MFM001 TaxID=2049453 RepID=UPI000DA47F48|nr:type VII secretion integral membrane protein EccD [Mycobacterium sp. MFM001]GBE64056.1 ESX-2 secretion system protein eccD2 [Mycobacterium sp. MFM001]
MAKVSFPARCAVAVVCGEHLISQVYPASVPIEVFIDSAVELLADELKRRGQRALTTGVAYELHRADGTRLDGHKTLDELGIEDGATLVLAPSTRGESFEPHYESLSTGLARIGKKLFEPVTAKTASNTAVVIVAMAAATIFALAVRVRASTASLVPSIVTAVFGLLVAAGVVAAWLWWPHRTDLVDGFAWIAMPLLAVSFAAAAPGPVGAAHLFIASLGLAAMSWGIAAATRRHIAVTATVVTLCVTGGAVAAVRMWRPVPAQWLGMCALVGLLAVLTLAPTITLWAARIRPPHFGSITGRDLFRRSDGLPADTVSPVDTAGEEETNLDSTPTGAQITAAAVRANRVLTGVCVGVAAALPVGVWATLMPGHGRSLAAAILAGLFVVIFISRGRAFADRRQAVGLVCGAAAAMCAGAVKYVVHQPAQAIEPMVWATLALAGFGGAGLAAALLVPITRFTPLVRMAAEWLELAAITAVVPLAAWVGGLFTWVRMR